MVTLEFVMDLLATMAPDYCDDIWWRCDGEYAPVTFFVHCNDGFAWGAADCEDVTPENIEVLKQAYKDSKYHGAELFCARVRNLRPQGALYSYIPREEWPLFDACGPERETGVGNPHKPGGYAKGAYSDKMVERKAEQEGGG